MKAIREAAAATLWAIVIWVMWAWSNPRKPKDEEGSVYLFACIALVALLGAGGLMAWAAAGAA